jgi:hypothetical protein
MLLEIRDQTFWAAPWHGRGRRFDPDQVHESIKRSQVCIPGLELRSPLFQNDSELPFVVETA